MVQCSLKATIDKVVSERNPFYGRLVQKWKVCDSFEMDYDNRENVCPFGIVADIEIGDETIHLDISSHYLNIDDDGWYYSTFEKDDLTYRFDMLYDGEEIDLDSTSLTTYYTEDYIDANDRIHDKVYAVDFKSIKTYFS